MKRKISANVNVRLITEHEKPWRKKKEPRNKGKVTHFEVQMVWKWNPKTTWITDGVKYLEIRHSLLC